MRVITEFEGEATRFRLKAENDSERKVLELMRHNLKQGRITVTGPEYLCGRCEEFTVTASPDA